MLYYAGLAKRRAKRRAPTARPPIAAMPSPTMFVVTQVRQALQQTVAAGPRSFARFASGSIRICAFSSTLAV